MRGDAVSNVGQFACVYGKEWAATYNKNIFSSNVFKTKHVPQIYRLSLSLSTAFIYLYKCPITQFVSNTIEHKYIIA